MGNPNIQFFSFPRTLSVENVTLRYHPFNASSNSNPSVGNWEAVLPERLEVHGIRVTQTIFDAQVPTLNVEFVTNGITYYNFAWANGDSPKSVDLSTTNSNTLSPPPIGSGEAPLLMESEESLGFRITDGNRLNNSDRLRFAITIWGIRFPT